MSLNIDAEHLLRAADGPARERLIVRLTYDSRVPHGDVTVGRDPETDWRPLPSCAEVLAHNNRSGAWLCVEYPDDLNNFVRVVVLSVHGDHVVDLGGATRTIANPAARYRPITRRGEALPWPGVQR